MIGFGPASSHLLPAQTATLNIVGDTIYCVVSVPVSALSGIDDDLSGGASSLEIARHSQDIAVQFNRRFHLSVDGRPGMPLMTMAWSPQTDGVPGDAAYVVVLHTVRFPVPPQSPSVGTDLFGSGAGEGQMTITAKHDKRADSAEVAILRPGTPEHVFFRGGLATFVDFIRIGVEHILTGPDHLLFLLTIIVAAAGWRYWLSLITSFTIAHSITLTLAAVKVVDVSANIVEPGIAASIVLMALLNLWQGGGSSAPAARMRLMIVFLCGLLHGLGFASAIDLIAADGAHRLAMLAGFNVGIEFGQFSFLAAILGLGALVRRTLALPRPMKFTLPQLASALAAVMGLVILVGRLMPLLPHFR